jgi:signal transduction histidine kinase
LTVRAVRVATALANMKSEFVATVTHELKAPLALMRLVGDTLSMGRYTSPDAVRDYARLLSEGARRHIRLIDNLLTWTRMADARRLYSFEPLEARELIEETLRSFQPRLDELGFDVRLRIADPLPRVRADREMLLLVLDNLVDNAVKYSNHTRVLIVNASAVDHHVRIVVADRGVGIPRGELPYVFDKFYRGHNARATGSGLGLATVKGIVSEHGGSVRIRSVPNIGTVVRIFLPAETPHVQASIGRRG